MSTWCRVMALTLGVGCLGATTGRSAGQDRGPLVIEGPQFSQVKFDRALGLRKVEVGRAAPLPPAVRFEVLTDNGWQPADHANSQFYVDAPKLSFGPGEPPKIDRNVRIALLGEHDMQVHAGSYGEFTPDPTV